MLTDRFTKIVNSLRMIKHDNSSGTEQNMADPGSIGDQPDSIEAEKYLKRQKILASVPDKYREVVNELLINNDLDIGDKVNIMKDLTTDTMTYLNVVNYLKECEAQSEPPTDFLSLLTQPKQRLLKRLMSGELGQNNITLIERILRNENEQVQKAIQNCRAPIVQHDAHVESLKSSSMHKMECEASAPDPSSRIQKPTNKMKDAFKNEITKTTPVDLQGASTTISDATTNKVFDKLPKLTTILLVGETGVGKTTFINAFGNYLKHGTFENAKKNGVEVFIKTYFSVVDDKCEMKDILCESTILEFNKEENWEDDEVTDAGQSSTQKPKMYTFTFGSDKKQIKMIDTPGLGDTRGIDQDDQNMNNIISFISSVKNINAICILLKSDVYRLSMYFRYCINEFLVRLHVSATKNILFCFTSTRSSFFTPGETLVTLRAYLDSLFEHKENKIDLDKNSLFCFDNEAFRILCAVRQGYKSTMRIEQDCNISWRESAESCVRLLNRTGNLSPHNIKNTLWLNNVRNIITSISRPLTETTRYLMINEKQYNCKLIEIDEHIKQENNLKDHLYVDQIKMVPRELDTPTTVCTSRQCVDYMRLSADVNSPMQAIYKTKCHEHCGILGVEIEALPNPALKDCVIFKKDINRCAICDCPWTSHMHIRYELIKCVEKTVDRVVEQSIEIKQAEIHSARLFIEELKNRRKEMQNDATALRRCYEELAAFVNTHSILPSNDSYLEYIDRLLQDEKRKVQMGCSDVIHKELENYKEQYNFHYKMGIECGDTTSNKSIEDIYAMLEDLRKIRSVGATLPKIQKLDMLSVPKDASNELCISIDISPDLPGCF